MHRAVILLASALAFAPLGACHLTNILSEPVDERRCRELNAFVPDTAQMQVGASRRLEAVGFQANGTTGTSCSASIRGGFQYSADLPAVATVEPTTGVVTARAVGRTVVHARWTLDGLSYTGDLTLSVVPQAQ
ncbi:MAG TPA: hypothetical protein VF461_18440 [Gemmatimonadaceae bacterium]